MNQFFRIFYEIRRVLSIPSLIAGSARSVKRDTEMVKKTFKKKEEKKPATNQ